MAFTSHGLHIHGTILEDRPKGLITKHAADVDCQQCFQEASNPELHIRKTVEAEHNRNEEKAILKAYDVLLRAGLSGSQVVEVLNELYRKDVIFRERKK